MWSIPSTGVTLQSPDTWSETCQKYHTLQNPEKKSFEPFGYLAKLLIFSRSINVKGLIFLVIENIRYAF